MPVLPGSLPDLIAFCAARSALWASSAAQIGLEEADVASWQAKIVNTQSKNNQRTLAVAAAKNATEVLRGAGSELRASSAELVRKIKFFAQSQPDPLAVYQAANIPAPQDPSVMPPPGTPGDFRATLNPDGSLTIAWKCKNPPGSSGTVYSIRRSTGGATGGTEIIGAVGVRKFTDHALPSVNAVTYQVQAQRGNKSGLVSSPFTVLFGTGGGGGFVITSQFEGTGEGGDGVKMAA
jgi:hypothetical protein